MGLIALTTKLHAGILQGRDIGTIVTNMTKEEFIAELNNPAFRGMYSGEHEDPNSLFYLRNTLLKYGLDEQIANRLVEVRQTFIWTETYSVVYYMEPLIDDPLVEPTFLKIERRPNDYVSNA